MDMDEAKSSKERKNHHDEAKLALKDSPCMHVLNTKRTWLINHACIINEAGDIAITMLTAKVINHKQKFSKNKLR
jgi:hypothetical protein